MIDLIERFLVGLVLGSVWQVCFENRGLERDPMLWNYDFMLMDTFDRWPEQAL